MHNITNKFVNVNKRTDSLETENIKSLSIVSLLTKTDASIMEIETALNMAHSILDSSDIGKINRSSHAAQEREC